MHIGTVLNSSIENWLLSSGFSIRWFVFSFRRAARVAALLHACYSGTARQTVQTTNGPSITDEGTTHPSARMSYAQPQKVYFPVSHWLSTLHVVHRFADYAHFVPIFLAIVSERPCAAVPGHRRALGPSYEEADGGLCLHNSLFEKSI